MSAIHHHDPIPRGALALAGALIVGSLALTGAVRSGLVDPAPSATALRGREGVAPLRTRELRFLDQPDGTVLILDGGSGATVARAGREGSGFIRGVMRGLARERRMHGFGAGPPFRLTAWTNGQLTLVDLATSRSIELASFGDTNRAAFARLLAEPS